MGDMMLKIVHLYSDDMNIYGDNGNVQTMVFRLQSRGINVEVMTINSGQELPADADIILSGGGQDTGQLTVADDLQTKAYQLLKARDDGVVMLAICGTYQLFGHEFITQQKDIIKGIGLFDMVTVAGQKRLIGNVVAESEFGQLVGFENHSGETTLSEGQPSLATVIKGAGNNSKTSDEGAISNNVFGSYLHGPCLPKNPVFADELLLRALTRKYGNVELGPIDDTFANRAAQIAADRPR